MRAFERERDVENYLVREVEKRGGIALKYSNGVKTGYPDRYCILPGGISFWVEVKANSKKPRPLQFERIAKLISLGAYVFVADSRKAVDSALNEMLK